MDGRHADIPHGEPKSKGKGNDDDNTRDHGSDNSWGNWVTAAAEDNARERELFTLDPMAVQEDPFSERDDEFLTQMFRQRQEAIDSLL